jgi:hypothetical protein
LNTAIHKLFQLRTNLLELTNLSLSCMGIYIEEDELRWETQTKFLLRVGVEPLHVVEGTWRLLSTAINVVLSLQLTRSQLFTSVILTPRNVVQTKKKRWRFGVNLSC